jgi:hypothetical protein
MDDAFEGQSGLDELEAFVDATVHIGAWDAPSAQLGQKLNVLERVIEVLRLRTGQLNNDLAMKDLLASGLSVERGAAGRPILHVRSGYRGKTVSSHTPDGLTQFELQVPLIHFLLHQHRRGWRIGRLIPSFLGEIQSALSPADVETTKTGVTRVVTTTRSTARTLRLHGLFADSHRTAYKTWELSTLGLLVGLHLYDRGASTKIAPRALQWPGTKRFGGSDFLTEAVASTLNDLADPLIVAQILARACTPNREVFSTFDQVVSIVTLFCERFAKAHDRRSADLFELRDASKALISSLESAVPAGALAEDIGAQLALRELIGERA